MNKVTTIKQLLNNSFDAKDLPTAVQLFTDAYKLNEAFKKKDEELIVKQMQKAIKRLKKEPNLASFTPQELHNLYPHKKVCFETLSPSDLAVKQLIRETLQ